MIGNGTLGCKVVGDICEAVSKIAPLLDHSRSDYAVWVSSKIRPEGQDNSKLSPPAERV
jgi:hypothetical protein